MKLKERRPVRKRDNAIDMDILGPEKENNFPESVKETAAVTVTEPIIVTAAKLFESKDIIDLGVCQDEELAPYLNIKGTELISLEVNSALEKGKILTEVFEKLSGNNQYDGLFYSWLTAMEYNPRTALRQRIKYELFCCGHDDRSKDFFATLPVVVIDKIHTHKEKELLISMVNTGEFKTPSDIINFIDEDVEAPGQKIKPVTTFYKSVFSFEKKLKKMNLSEAHKALDELKDVEKEVKRLRKLIQQKEEEATLENNLKLVD